MSQPPAELQLCPFQVPTGVPTWVGPGCGRGSHVTGVPTGVGVRMWVEAAACYGPHAEDVFHFNWGVGLSGQE